MNGNYYEHSNQPIYGSAPRQWIAPPPGMPMPMESPFFQHAVGYSLPPRVPYQIPNLLLDCIAESCPDPLYEMDWTPTDQEETTVIVSAWGPVSVPVPGQAPKPEPYPAPATHNHRHFGDDWPTPVKRKQTVAASVPEPGTERGTKRKGTEGAEGNCRKKIKK